MLRRITGWWIVLCVLFLWSASSAVAQDPIPPRPGAPAPTSQPKAKAPSARPQARPTAQRQPAARPAQARPAPRPTAARKAAPKPQARKTEARKSAPRKVEARKASPRKVEARKAAVAKKAKTKAATKKDGKKTDTALALQKEIQQEQAKDFIKNYWSRGPLLALLLIFIAGFFVSLTPCVYPMIPITIAVIGATSQGEHHGRGHSFLLAFLYVVGMAIPYAALGVAVSYLGRLPFMLGGAFNNPYFLLFLVTLFGLMAISMFGAFDLALPSSWQTKMSMFQGKGFLGIIVLGMIGALLATPCSGPVIVGLLAFIAQTGSAKWGIIMPTVFTLGVGVPFLVLGGGVVQALPRSGKWMTEVKKIFGVILLAASLYYGYLLARRLVPKNMEYFNLGFSMLLLFLGLSAGAFRSYSKDNGYWETFKQTFGIATFVVGLYLFAGTLLTQGFLLPPLKKLIAVPAAKVTTQVVTQQQGKPVAKKPRDKCLPPENHPADKPYWFKSEKEGAACAKKLKRPMIIDFWAEWCKSCKQLERESFNTAAVAKESRRFIMIKYEYNETSKEDDRLRKKYTIPGLPWVRFTSSNGKLLKKPRLIGFVKADKLLKLMRQVR